MPLRCQVPERVTLSASAPCAAVAGPAAAVGRNGGDFAKIGGGGFGHHHRAGAAVAATTRTAATPTVAPAGGMGSRYAAAAIMAFLLPVRLLSRRPGGSAPDAALGPLLLTAERDAHPSNMTLNPLLTVSTPAFANQARWLWVGSLCDFPISGIRHGYSQQERGIYAQSRVL
jgi:hypothetical protein